MTDITSALSKIQIEEVSYGKAVSEYTATKTGASINYLIDLKTQKKPIKKLLILINAIQMLGIISLLSLII